MGGGASLHFEFRSTCTLKAMMHILQKAPVHALHVYEYLAQLIPMQENQKFQEIGFILKQCAVLSISFYFLPLLFIPIHSRM